MPHHYSFILGQVLDLLPRPDLESLVRRFTPNQTPGPASHRRLKCLLLEADCPPLRHQITALLAQMLDQERP
jgi:hypothetical protein